MDALQVNARYYWAMADGWRLSMMKMKTFTPRSRGAEANNYWTWHISVSQQMQVGVRCEQVRLVVQGRTGRMYNRVPL